MQSISSHLCYVRAATFRATFALIAPVGAIVSAIVLFWNQGYSVAEYPALIAAGHLSLSRQAGAWLALIACFTRYYPAAWLALWHGPCLVWQDASHLHLSGRTKVRRTDVVGARVVWNFFRKRLEIETRDGRVITFPLYFMREIPSVVRKRLTDLALV